MGVIFRLLKKLYIKYIILKRMVAMENNIKPMARIPIVPSNYSNKEDHKLHELVMDYTNNDIYVKDPDGYVNITGKIKETVKNAISNGAVIEIVTEDTIPVLDSRKKNHWYLVITEAETDTDNPSKVIVDTYVYYGLIDKTYNIARNYSLLSQNTISARTDATPIKFLLTDGYSPCFYVPSTTQISVVYDDVAHTPLETKTIESIYIFSPQDGTYSEYNVIMFDKIDPNITNGKQYLNVLVTIYGSDSSNISFDTMVGAPQIKAILPIQVENHSHILQLPHPEWEDRRFKFKGWSLKKNIYDPIDINEYIVIKPITLYAWFDYEAPGTRSTVTIVQVDG